mmetsp:Transcript_30799/g.49823  ORF Transcript_30799/g.49823 Transcript_30799/m.49823 type:complete len:382 (+) Transcript_30799:157-1302(+)
MSLTSRFDFLDKTIQRHPDEAEIDGETHKFTRKYGYEYHSYLTELVSLAYNYLPKEDIQRTANLLAWLWMVDDIIDDHTTDDQMGRPAQHMCDLRDRVILESTETLESIIKSNHWPILLSPGFCDGEAFPSLLPCTQMLIDGLSAFDESHSLCVYIAKQALNYITKGCVPELTIPHDVPIPIDTYDNVRFYCGGMDFVFGPMILDVVRSAASNSPSPSASADRIVALLESEHVRRCLDLANLVGTSINDIYSFWKECTRDKSAFNRVKLYMVHEDLDVDDALDAVAKMANDNFAKLEEAFNDDRSFDDMSRLIIKRAAHWLKAELLWHCRCKRYAIGAPAPKGNYDGELKAHEMGERSRAALHNEELSPHFITVKSLAYAS